MVMHCFGSWGGFRFGESDEALEGFKVDRAVVERFDFLLMSVGEITESTQDQESEKKVKHSG